MVVPQGRISLKDAPGSMDKDNGLDTVILKNMGISMDDVKKYAVRED